MFGYSPAVVIIGAAAVYIVLVILLIHANGISTADIIRNKQWFTGQVWSSLQHLVDLCACCYGSDLVHIARAQTQVITGTTDSH